MGEGYGYRCNTCNYNEIFYTGIGFKYYEMMEKVKKDIINDKYGLKAKEFLNDYPDSEINISRGLFRCDFCDNLKEKLFIHLKSQYAEYEKQYLCGKCRRKMKLVVDPNKEDKIRCPICHKRMNINEYILWD